MNGRIPEVVWESLVGETQFATELALTGLSRLCSVPTAPDLFPWDSKDSNFALHVGMYSYASGLERLCKLAIACNGYATTGKFPNLRKYSHKIGTLLDAVEALSMPPSSPGPSKRETKYLVRPLDGLDPDLMGTVERFASGAGRYEHLDVLWNDDAEVNTYNEWSALAARVSVSEEVRRLISLKDAMAHAIGSELTDDGLESSARKMMEDLERPMYVPSVGVVLSLFRKVRWVSTTLGVATYYTHEDLPILGEIVSPAFLHTSADFFNYNIARFSDDAVIEEELEEVYERINVREAGMDDEDLDEIGIEK
ncbi:hypothetical protein ART_3406 [Arthrobacter sp. PAMC 25486]|uniref:hypothetical protein n=1 Tax=Arthrobacter sp. PAMC 25486 TaxID=1494608 RepID=UPI0005360854|nr:hypothetical protein [Arthrobacter sp. PAMC 25486]AIY03005.1 hypothetical protein ART_3406 [Arthrobacter sp. PAMC 25486]